MPFWLLMHIEGTRFTKKKLEDSQRFAKSRGYPVLHHVLFPRTKGFVATIAQLRFFFFVAKYSLVL